MSANATYNVAGDHVIYQDIGEELMLINLQSGVYYSVPDVGSVVWKLLAQGMTVGEVADVLANHYGQPQTEIAPTISAFVERLLAEGLIEVAVEAAHEEIPAPSLDLSSTFTPPVLEVYNDMQDLLLVDPIHDVDESGWPHPHHSQEATQKRAWWNPFQ